MNYRRVVTLVALVVSVIMLSGLAVGVTVEAASTEVVDSSAAVAGDYTGGGFFTPTPTSGDVIMEGYTVYLPNDPIEIINVNSPVNEITPDMEVFVVVRIVDRRIDANMLHPGAPELVLQNSPMAYLNTSSFVKSRSTWAGDCVPENNTANVNTNDGSVYYSLIFPVTYTGTGNTFAFDLHYADETNLPMYSFSINLNQCVERVDSSSQPVDSSSTVVRGTGFALKNASYGTNDISVGDTFTLSLTLLATNGSYGVDNVYATVTPSKEIELAEGSSVVYFGNVSPNQEIPVSFQLAAGAVENEGTYTVKLTVTGNDANTGSEVTASMDIAIPIMFPERFEIFNVQLPDYLTVNSPDSAGYASITLVNKGKGVIHNVSVSIVGDGLATEEGNQFIGNIASGAQNSADFTMTATMGGELSGQVLVKYEDAKGEEKTLTHDFTVMAEEAPDMSSPSDMSFPEEEVQTGVPRWVWLLVGAVVAAGVIVVVVIVLKKRKAKKNAALLDDSEEYTDENS